MTGVKIVEVASWTFVPSGGAILADLGADVIKVEPPTGDPQRGLKNLLNRDAGGVNPFLEVPNRGKRSISLDLTSEGGYEILCQLVATADVFVTSSLPSICAKLRITVDDVRAMNPNVIYARGSGWGTTGPMAETAGFDLAAAWASCGLAAHLTPPGGEPPMQPSAFFDLQGGAMIASAISAALFARERTGEPSEVDVSLLNVGMWAMSQGIVGAVNAHATQPPPDRFNPGNPLVNWYRTADGRWLYLVLLQADRYWAELCRFLDCPDLVDDPRFNNATVRHEHRREFVEALDEVFATKTMEEWKQVLDGFSGVWAPVLRLDELHSHPQVDANGFLPHLTDNAGTPFRIVASPMQFDRTPTTPQGPAPEVGQHTEDILLELGFDWDQIGEARQRGVLG